MEEIEARTNSGPDGVDKNGFLRWQKLQDGIKEAFLSNADEFLSFMSKTEIDTGFRKFFFSEMFKWYDQTIFEKPSKLRPETSIES
jgi:hypothetical protein